MVRETTDVANSTVQSEKESSTEKEKVSVEACEVDVVVVVVRAALEGALEGALEVQDAKMSKVKTST